MVTINEGEKLLYQHLINHLIKEKGLECTNDFRKRAQIVRNKKGRKVELPYSALGRMDSLEAYLILKSVF